MFRHKDIKTSALHALRRRAGTLGRPLLSARVICVPSRNPRFYQPLG